MGGKIARAECGCFAHSYHFLNEFNLIAAKVASFPQHRFGDCHYAFWYIKDWWGVLRHIDEEVIPWLDQPTENPFRIISKTC
jgi:hypothetical protein